MASQASEVALADMGYFLECPLCADCVEKLENRAAPKISQMLRIVDFSRCNAL
jgi:hypothetical protein